MKSYFIETGANTGEYNMKFDLRLADESEAESINLRLYTWDPYCISLGANQSFESLDIKKLTADGFECVKRPTGGRAVFHSEELTYSVVINSGAFTPKGAYKQINEALLLGLSFYDSRLTDAGLENEEVNFKQHYSSGLSAACFSVPSRSEVKFDGRKLIGSAQRKTGNVILQHGSINTGDFHKRIVDYLILSGEEKRDLQTLLDNKTSDIRSITGQEVDMQKLSDAIVKGFRQEFKLGFENLIKLEESLENR
ncbi:MAG: hypothetical protein IPN18_14180 [Ignavibacteriales bacterium]|jgi:lipoate-protein ligase A|nr:hypothetical protein [Ignavibacteriales bacterium]